jgi:hypothetical protein
VGFFWGGGWGWDCSWGGGDININRNNNFNSNTNFGEGNRVTTLGGGGDKWQHNPAHRGGAPYADRNTANRFGGPARGDSLANRQQGAQNQTGRQGGSLGNTTRPGGVVDRDTFGNRGTPGNRDSSLGGVDRVGNRSLGNDSSYRGAFGGLNGDSARSSVSRGSASMGSSRWRRWTPAISDVLLNQTYFEFTRDEFADYTNRLRS